MVEVYTQKELNQVEFVKNSEADKRVDSARGAVAWAESFAWLCAVVAFSPALVWLYDGLVQSQQLRDAIIILACAVIVIALESDIRPRRPVFTRESLYWLIFSYAALAAGPFLGMWGVFLTLAGLSGVLVSVGLAFFEMRRYSYAVGGAFYSFTILSLFLPAFDFPLRAFAGTLSAKILALFNDSVALMLVKGVAPQLVLTVDGAHFVVAAECNGFGIISSCLVLSVVTVLFRKISWIKRVAIVCAAVLFAYIANTMRIVVIVSLAPYFGENRYMLMHESVGYIVFALALLAVWRMCKRF